MLCISECALQIQLIFVPSILVFFMDWLILGGYGPAHTQFADNSDLKKSDTWLIYRNWLGNVRLFN